MSAVGAVGSATADGQASDQNSVDQSIMNFATAMAQSTRTELGNDLNKLQQKWEQIKQESGEQ